MAKNKLWAVFFMAFLLISTIQGQGDSSELLKIPQGKRILEFFEAFNSGDREVLRLYIEEHYSPSNLKRNPVDQELFFFQNFYHTNRKMVLHKIIEISKQQITVLVQAQLSERWLIHQFLFSTDDPDKIDRLRIGTGQPPEEFALKKKMTRPEICAELDRFISKLEEADTFSGAVLLAKDDSVIFKKATGLASKRFGVPNRIDTRFNLGSMNKMFTGLAIVQLAEKGKLSFNDPIIRHVPDYPNRQVAEKVTIQHLLTHTSGMGHFWNEKYDDEYRWLRTVEDHIPLFADEPLAFEPGEKWLYSNAGFTVLGLIIERITGQSYYDYVERNIFKPADMTHTGSYEMDKPVPNIAIGYTRLSPDEKQFTGEWRNNNYIRRIKGGPSGGGFSTVEDLFKFARALRNQKLLGPEYNALILNGISGLAPETEYAYGFRESTIEGQRFIGHTGGTAGAETIFKTSPDSGITFVILSNYDHSIRPLTEKLQQFINSL